MKIGRKYQVAVIIALLFVVYRPLPVMAQEATSTSSLSTKLKALQAEIASKAAQLKAEVTKKLQNRAYIGFVKLKSSTSLTLATRAGSKIVNINDFTDFYSGDQKTNLKTLNTDDYVAALGDVDETGVLTARRVVKLKQPSSFDRVVLWGYVTQITDSTITLKPVNNQLQTFAVDKTTSYQMGKNNTDFTAIRQNKAVIVVGFKSDKINKARFIYILPYSISLKVKNATSSATPSAVKK
ncbi:hypothetical protein HY389_01780 [Candidatus Daviesbacteria bacterium]|nr:hypothetical protein [Candidatus Daviesbacteria bacterium]